MADFFQVVLKNLQPGNLVMPDYYIKKTKKGRIIYVRCDYETYISERILNDAKLNCVNFDWNLYSNWFKKNYPFAWRQKMAIFDLLHLV